MYTAHTHAQHTNSEGDQGSLWALLLFWFLTCFQK